ncbi:MAG: hypothetical protein U0165_12040 [Polyangiaceae bacterium]
MLGLRTLRKWVSFAALVSAFAVVSPGCARPPFTLAVLDRFRLTSTDLQHVQFFTSDTIILRRDLTTQERAMTGNELLVRDGVIQEEVVIPAKTPGVAVRIEYAVNSDPEAEQKVSKDPAFILVSFSREHPERALWFAVKRPFEVVVPLDDKRFELVHLENTADEPGPFVPRFTKGFQVIYAGKPYQLSDAAMWGVHLLYEDTGYARKKIREEPEGWKVNDGAPAPAPQRTLPPATPSSQPVQAAPTATPAPAR